MKSFLESMVVMLWEKSQCPLLFLDETLRWVESSPDWRLPTRHLPFPSETHTPSWWVNFYCEFRGVTHHLPGGSRPSLASAVNTRRVVWCVVKGMEAWHGNCVQMGPVRGWLGLGPWNPAACSLCS